MEENKETKQIIQELIQISESLSNKKIFQIEDLPTNLSQQESEEMNDLFSELKKSIFRTQRISEMFPTFLSEFQELTGKKLQSSAIQLLLLGNDIQSEYDFQYLSVNQMLSSSTNQNSTKVFPSIKNRIQTMISGIGILKSKLLRLLSRFTNLKEWKISGELGSGILGMGKVGLEFTFIP